MKEKGFVFNYKELTVRGSFVNLLFTLAIVGLIIFGAFNESVAGNLKTLEALIIATYATSFGVWQGKKYLEGKNKEEPE